MDGPPILRAGSVDALIVVVPTADGRIEYGQRTPMSELLRALGATNVEVLHTVNRRFVKSIEILSHEKMW